MLLMITVWLFVLGLIFGSFINALVWRVKNNKDWVKERSICVHCKHELQARYLIPVISWLWLRGKCAYCKKPISWHYPAIELFTGFVFALSYLVWESDFTLAGIILFILWLKITVLLIALLLYDLKWMLLPNKFVAPVTFLSALYVIVNAASQGSVGVAVDGVGGGLLLFGLFYGIFQVSGGKWIGGGDVKLALSLGLLAGSVVNAMLLLFVASILGTLVALPMLITHKAKAQTKLPFGPFLILATMIIFFWGNQIIDWYTSLLYI